MPSGLSASAVSSSQINLSWNAATDNVGVTGYRVYRGGSQIATTAAASFSNTGLNASTAYSYKVAAIDAAGNVSGQSASASATTSAAAPPPPPSTAPVGSVIAGSFTLAANASDNVLVTRVEFSVDGKAPGD